MIISSLYYNGANSYLFVSGIEIYKFKEKDSETAASTLSLGDLSKDWTVDKMKRTGLNRLAYHFCADYNGITVDNISDIHKYLMKKNNVI